MRKQVINFLVLFFIFVNISTAMAEQSKIATVYLDEYKRNENGGYIPSEKEIYAFAEKKAREMGDEVLDVTCMLSVDSTNSAIVWKVEITECEDGTGNVYIFEAETEVFMNEIWSSPPLIPENKDLHGYTIGQKEDYAEYLKKRKKSAEFTLKWTELYGLSFTWNPERKHEFYLLTKQLPYEVISSWLVDEVPELSGWSFPDDDAKSFRAEINSVRKEARSKVMEHYLISEEDINSLIEDIRCYGPYYNLEFVYWMKAYLAGNYYYIPLCRVAPNVYDMRTKKTIIYLQGLDKDIVPYINFGG